MSDDKLKIFQEKLKVYSDKSIPVHITLKNDGWANGFIREVSADFFMLDEFRKGLMPIFFLEVVNVETYTKKEGDNDNT